MSKSGLKKTTAEKIQRDYFKWVEKAEAKYGVKIGATFTESTQDDGVTVYNDSFDDCKGYDCCSNTVEDEVFAFTDSFDGNRATTISVPDGSYWQLDYSEALEKLCIRAFDIDNSALIDGADIATRDELASLVEELSQYIPLLPA